MRLPNALSFSLAFAAVALAADAPVIPTPEKVLEDYKKFVCITKEPKAVGAEFAGLCIPTSAMEQVQKEAGPHAVKYLNYYLNDVAQRQFQGSVDGNYPAGSVLVKEKLFAGGAGLARDFTRVDAVAGMIKGALGSSPKTHDWQFFYFDRAYGYDAGGRAEPKSWRRAKDVQGCAGCHSNAKDMVFARFTEPYKIPGVDKK